MKLAANASPQTPGWDEAERLAALARYGVLDTEREPAFDDIAQLAADIFEAPIAVVNFVASDRQWFKAEIGIGARELPLDVSICRHAILQPGVFVVPDLAADPRFAANPLVNVAAGLRFYAGAPLEADGLPIGTVCVLDRQARPAGITDRQSRGLRILASQVMAQLELRRSTAAAQLQTRELQHITDSLPVMIAFIDTEQRYRFANSAYGCWFGMPRRDIIGRSVAELLGPELHAERRARIEAALRGEEQRFEGLTVAPDGGKRHTETSYIPRRDERGRVAGFFVLGTDLTTREAAIAALRESEERFRLMADSSPALIWVSDAQANIVFANKRYEEVFGHPAADLHGEGWRRIMHPDDAEPFAARYRAAFETRQRFKIDARVVDRQGRELYLQCEGVPRFDANGRFAGYVGVNLDVTDAKLAEQAMRKQANELAAIYDAAPVGLCVLDRDLRDVRINERLAEINGIPAADHIGRTVKEIVPDLDEQIMAIFHRVLAGEAVLGIELTGETAARPGVMRAWRENWVPLRASGGEVIGIALSAEEITEERAAAEALKASEATLRELNETLEARVAERTAELSDKERRFRAIFDSTFQLTGLCALDGTILVVNQAALDAVEATQAEVAGVKLWDAPWWARTPGEAERVRDELARVAQGAFVRYDTSLLLPAGERVFDFSMKPVFGDDGRPVMLVAEGRDVTDVKRTEEALRQSQKLESMGQLTGGVAHDFNNLLTPIIGSLDLLQRRGLGGPREQRLIDGAMQSAERAKTLVQRLLAFARRQPLQPVAVDLEELIGGMAGLIASTSGPVIRLQVDVAPGLPRVKADPNQIEMAILNLAVNARDAMPEGGRLTIAASPADGDGGAPVQPGRYVRLAIADTGIGMDEETAAKAIEPFFSTKGVGRGTGLGLSMVHGFASQLGGALTIESRPGKGTTVELWLPVTDDARAPAERAPQDRLMRGSGTVLLVDDEEIVRMTTTDMLVDLGYTVIEAESGEAALARVSDGVQFDLLVTDHLMPGMRGTELVEQVRARRPDVPTVLISGYAESEGVSSELPRLTKPFRRAELAAMLDGVFKGALKSR